jgi:competence protein ComEC
MSLSSITTLRQIPFLRLLIALIAGIIVQWYLQFTIHSLLVVFISTAILLFIFYFLPSSKQFAARWIQGIAIVLLFIITGSIISYLKDISHHYNRLENFYKNNATIRVTLQEPLVLKPKSYKALASVNAIQVNNMWQPVKGNILLYFKRDSIVPQLSYGSQIIFKKKLQPIVNSGNPGAFDYKRYCLFQNIQQQVFLQQNDYVILSEKNTNWIQQQLYNIRTNVIKILQQNISGKKEQGVSEFISKLCQSSISNAPFSGTE